MQDTFKIHRNGTHIAVYQNDVLVAAGTAESLISFLAGRLGLENFFFQDCKEEYVQKSGPRCVTYDVGTWAEIAVILNKKGVRGAEVKGKVYSHVWPRRFVAIVRFPDRKVQWAPTADGRAWDNTHADKKDD